jgi:hypothetical protein
VEGDSIPVRAELRVRPGFASNFPESLRFRVTRNDGGTGGVLSRSTADAGVYPAQWEPPGEGVFLLTAAYPADGGPSTTVQLTVDNTPPTFNVTVPPADEGPSQWGAVYGDPALAHAWRRDQVVPVKLRTNEPNLELASLKVRLYGTEGGAAPEVNVTPFAASEHCDAGFCGVARVKLWEPPFNVFRGQMRIEVRGHDKGGHEATSSTSLDVTRWKWVFHDESGAIKTPPAIGARGTVYVGTNGSSSGKVFALNPTGALEWQSQVGAVVGGPAVGSFDGSTELIYVGANSASDGSLYALQSGNGGAVLVCTVPADGAFQGALALGKTGAALVETASSVYNVSSGSAVIVGISPGAPVKCPVTESPSRGEQIPRLFPGAPVVMRNDSLFFSGSSSSGFKVTSYTVGSPTPRAGWPVTSSAVPRDLVLVGPDIVGAAASSDPVMGGLFGIPQEGAMLLTPLYPPGSTWSSRVFSLAVGGSNVAFFGAEQAGYNNSLNRFGLSAPSGAQRALGYSSIRATPVIGANGTVYTVTTVGNVEAWAADALSPRWSLPAASALGSVEASPTLDCSRDATGAVVEGNHGVLYVPAGGNLYAFVVDSRGLNSSAPWPKYQHDVRNTGNLDTPINNCP